LVAARIRGRRYAMWPFSIRCSIFANYELNQADRQRESLAAHAMLSPRLRLLFRPGGSRIR
jgi:hypothetical protein